MSYKKYTLKNGMRLVVVPLKSNPTATVMITANVGSRYELAENSGISHFLEHLMFKGTKQKTSREIMLELDTLGAAYNAFTSYEVTAYWVKSNKKFLDKTSDILLDLYLNAQIPEQELEKERGVILEEINMYEDDNQSKVHDVLRTLIYGDNQLGRPIIGTKENIKKLQRDDFMKYKEIFYNGPSTTIVISGDVNPVQIKKSIEQRIEKISGEKLLDSKLAKGKLNKVSKIKEKQSKPQVKIFNKKTDQTHMVLAFRTFDFYHKDMSTMKVLQGILSAGMSSRLFHKMREELGICYYCYAAPEYSYDSGYLGIFAGVGNKRLEEAIQAIMDILRDIKNNGVTEKELDKVKKNFTGKMAMSLESSDDFATFYGQQEFFHHKIKHPKEKLQEIKAVTVNDVKKLANKILKEEKANLAIVGPHKNETKLEKLLNF